MLDALVPVVVEFLVAVAIITIAICHVISLTRQK